MENRFNDELVYELILIWLLRACWVFTNHIFLWSFRGRGFDFTGTVNRTLVSEIGAGSFFFYDKDSQEGVTASTT